MIVVFAILISFLFKSKSQTLNDYLEMLQSKLEEEKNWKMLVEELHAGIGLIG